MSKYKEALEEMVWQFAYRMVRDGKPILCTGGLSALEGAFMALGWSDPKYIDDYDGVICDVEGCGGWVVVQGGVWRPKYWMVCSEHHQDALDGKQIPKMKQRAIDRENSRDKNGRLPVGR